MINVFRPYLSKSPKDFYSEDRDAFLKVHQYFKDIVSEIQTEFEDPDLNTELYGLGKPFTKPLPPTKMKNIGKKRPSIFFEEKDSRKLKRNLSTQVNSTEVDDPDLFIQMNSQGKPIKKHVLEQVKLDPSSPGSTIELLGVESDGTERVTTQKNVGEGEKYNLSTADAFET